MRFCSYRKISGLCIPVSLRFCRYKEFNEFPGCCLFVVISIIKCPEGQWYFAVEGTSGEFGVYLDSRGDKSPYRMKLRPMALTLVAALDEMLQGTKVADLIAVGAGLDYIIPDIDR